MRPIIAASREILAFATNMEHAGDIVDSNLLGLAPRSCKRGPGVLQCGRGGVAGDDRPAGRQSARRRLAVHDRDERAARLLAAEKEVFRGMEAAATEAHFERLRSGRIDTAETSALHLDALRDLKSVNTHLVAAAAYPVLESKGELLPSRLRQND